MPRKRAGQEAGVAAVEFALVALVFFTLLFGVLELARVLFLYNTVQEVTRRAASSAANTDFTNPTALDALRHDAIFSTPAGNLPLADHVTAEAIRIDYLSVEKESDGSFNMIPIPSGSLPGSPSQNRDACLISPYASNCIRLVRVRVCDPADIQECAPIRIQSLVPLVDLSFPLPLATTVTKAESLGYSPGG
jgi:hypothetical protein